MADYLSRGFFHSPPPITHPPKQKSWPNKAENDTRFEFRTRRGENFGIFGRTRDGDGCDCFAKSSFWRFYLAAGGGGGSHVGSNVAATGSRRGSGRRGRTVTQGSGPLSKNNETMDHNLPATFVEIPQSLKSEHTTRIFLITLMTLKFSRGGGGGGKGKWRGKRRLAQRRDRTQSRRIPMGEKGRCRDAVRSSAAPRKSRPARGRKLFSNFLCVRVRRVWVSVLYRTFPPIVIKGFRFPAEIW